MKLAMRAFRLLMVLWAGSCWSLLWVAGTVFHFQSDRHTAGLIAGRLFSIEAYLGIAVAALALVSADRRRFLPGFIAVALLCMNEWILKTAMARALTHGSAVSLSFGAWHAISAGIYVLACLCIVVVIYQDGYRHA